LINGSAAKLLGFSSPEAAIGKDILRGDRKWTVIGVVADYHQKSLRYALEPMIFMPFYGNNNEISVKITPGDLPGTIAQVKNKYEAFFPGNLFLFRMPQRHSMQRMVTTLAEYIARSVQANELPNTVLARDESWRPNIFTSCKYCKISTRKEKINTRIHVVRTGRLTNALTKQ